MHYICVYMCMNIEYIWKRLCLSLRRPPWSVSVADCTVLGETL